MKQSVISYVPMAERYDVLVLGGGTAGVMAACAAARRAIGTRKGEQET